ncbi:DUF5707 domain-containing protein [Streptomyces sp. enrichment culture]|uniref:DUF5707 domain-containing protein n=1 Tax=Streptomyces sp. enrichment culture TaxID=1795815 RepID=UPI003F56EA32
MRIRTLGAAVSGALALTALAVPAAQANDDDGKPYPLNFRYSNVKVNNGKPIVAGTAGSVSASFSYTLTHPAGVGLQDKDHFLTFTPVGAAPDDRGVRNFWANCEPVTATSATCGGTIHYRPGQELQNAAATTYDISAVSYDWNGQNDPANDDLEEPQPIDWDKVGMSRQDGLGTVKYQRLAKLAANATPEPVTKGRTITVIGKLTRANWDTHYYGGVAGQYVKLQYKKQGTTGWTTLKTVRSSATGALKATTTATYDGYYRYSYAGATTTTGAVSPADHVDVTTQAVPGGSVAPVVAGPRFGDAAPENGPVVSDVTVHGGKSVLVGSGSAKTFSVSVTASHPSGIADASVYLWRGSNSVTDVEGLLPQNEKAATCTATSDTTSTCKLTVTARPGLNDPEGVGDLFANYLAGSWRVAVQVKAKDSSVTSDTSYKGVKIQRNTALTVNASPEPVRKGRTLTVTGKLTRADWETGTYGTLAGQWVNLEFRKKGATEWTLVAQTRSSSTGVLRETTTATVDGSYRFVYEGGGYNINTNGPSVSREDAVDVQ